MKKNFLIVLFFLGIILSTIFVNMRFDISKLSYSFEKELTYINVFGMLFRRCAILVFIVFILKIISDYISDYVIIFLSGFAIGCMVSIRSYSGEILNTFIYTVIVSIIVMLYSLIIKIIIPGENNNAANTFVKLHNSVAGKILVITILLTNMFIELRILKFF